MRQETESKLLQAIDELVFEKPAEEEGGNGSQVCRHGLAGKGCVGGVSVTEKRVNETCVVAAGLHTIEHRVFFCV